MELEQCHFRSVRASTQTIKKSIAAQVELFELLIDELDKEIAFPPVSFKMFEEPLTGVDVIEQVAERFRKDQGLGLGPISSMTRLAEKVGVLVVRIADADDRVDAFSLYNKRPLIVRNTAKMNPCWQRFDLAHELDHLVLHRYRDRLPRFREPSQPVRERPANAQIQLCWKVSFKALIYRAGTLDLITHEHAKSGFTYLNRNGFTKHEDLDDEIPMELPALVQRAIDLLDYASWRKILRAAGLTSNTVVERYLLRVPASPLSLV